LSFKWISFILAFIHGSLGYLTPVEYRGLNTLKSAG